MTMFPLTFYLPTTDKRTVLPLTFNQMTIDENRRITITTAQVRQNTVYWSVSLGKTNETLTRKLYTSNTICIRTTDQK